ncbi:MAG: phosphotransferase, partial [Thioalkalivibrio sp.]|nr:phosphotransferase [Thioalkalivibrio sp.]
FVLQRLSEALRAPRASVRDLLEGQRSTLGISEQVGSDLFARYRRQVTGSFFDFEVPRTTMHGDFTLPNALVGSNGFLLIDWEYANESGSVLFDAWFLRRSIVRQARRLGDPNLSDPNAVAELDRGIDAFGLRRDQVDAFGHAMHALQDFAQMAARGAGAATLAVSVRELERLAGGSHDSTASERSSAA